MALRPQPQKEPSGSPTGPQPVCPSHSGPSPRASGRVILSGSDRGIRGLTVEAVHVERSTSQRLGSTLSGSDGSFTIGLPSPEVSGPAASAGSRGGWNLQLMVLGAERRGMSRRRRLLFSTEIRRRAGIREEFLIELSERALRAAGIPPSATRTAVEAHAEAVRSAFTRSEESRVVADRVLEGQLKAVSNQRNALREEIVQRLRAEFSGVSERERNSDRFAATDDLIERVHVDAVIKDVQTLTAPRRGRRPAITRRSRITLTEAQRVELLGRRGGPQRLSEAQIERVVRASLDKPASISRRGLADDPCRPRTEAERCLDDSTTVQTNGSQPSPSTNQPGTNVSFNQSAYVARLMDRQTSPEDPISFGADGAQLEEPLTAGGVSAVINGLNFSPGPADVPAFYDFHDIQIAFEPVWQEALDGQYLNDVESVYDRVVESAGSPALTVIQSALAAPSPQGFFRTFVDSILRVAVADETTVPFSVASSVVVSLEEWRALPGTLRVELQTLGDRMVELRELARQALNPEIDPWWQELAERLPDVLGVADIIRVSNTPKVIAYRSQIQLLRADAERLVAHARRILLEREARGHFAPTHEIIERLRRQRGSTYPFRYFAASRVSRSVNFGLMVTYRQQWTPISYQAGELVSTIPMGPREIRRFSKRTVIRTKRVQQEIESNLTSRRGESEERSRAEAEIVARATAKTNFSLSNSGTLTFAGEGPISGSATATTTFTRDAERHSEAVKKEFREAILKSAEEYKNERKIEVTTEATSESEVTESGEIQNPNDEIPVTFLFYELQRRFRVSEKLHRLQSVVFVAQEMPPPSAIDASWLIRHDWILNRVLLDDSFRPALTYVATTLVSEETVLRAMREALFRQRKLVEELKEDVAERRVLEGLRYAALQRQIERTASSAGSGGGFLSGLGDLVSGVPVIGDVVEGGIDLLTGGGDTPSEAARIREGASRDAYDRERQAQEEFASRLMNAISTLEGMQRAYSERLGEHLRQLTQVERLATHVVQNVMHYMQAIWSYEPNDQRFLRLRNVPVPIFHKDKGVPHAVINPAAVVVPSDVPAVSARTFEVVVDPTVIVPPQRPEELETLPLSEVADINGPLGYIGNYMIFPMYESNPITDFMMNPYVVLAEGQYGVSDPDPLGNVTLEEFADYVCCLRDYFAQQAASSSNRPRGSKRRGPAALSTWASMQPVLRDTLRRLLQLSLRNNDEIIVPTNALYIEALPGAHSVMEKFKNLHRQIDVKTAQEELRRQAIDNVRRAQRILDDELEDPDIEAKYVFEGGGGATVIAPGAPPAGSTGGGS
jgi:hypothetical protein